MKISSSLPEAFTSLDRMQKPLDIPIQANPTLQLWSHAMSLVSFFDSDVCPMVFNMERTVGFGRVRKMRLAYLGWLVFSPTSPACDHFRSRLTCTISASALSR